jgi:hypothetical protein
VKSMKSYLGTNDAPVLSNGISMRSRTMIAASTKPAVLHVSLSHGNS